MRHERTLRVAADNRKQVAHIGDLPSSAASSRTRAIERSRHTAVAPQGGFLERCDDWQHGCSELLGARNLRQATSRSGIAGIE